MMAANTLPSTFGTVAAFYFIYFFTRKSQYVYRCSVCARVSETEPDLLICFLLRTDALWPGANFVRFAAFRKVLLRSSAKSC